MEPKKATFTAVQIAAALKTSRQAVQWHLRDVRPDGLRIVSGQEAQAWRVSSLPAELRSRLEAEATRRGYRSVEHLLSDPAREWQPVFPLAEMAGKEIERANKLREALAPFLVRQHDGYLSAAEFEGQGVREYRRIFRHEISDRHWRALFRRTVERDAGAENWGRIELYVSDKPQRKPGPEIICVALEEIQDQFPAIADSIAECGNPAAPAEDEQHKIWHDAFEEYNRLVSQGETEKRAARRVRDFLARKAAFLAPSRNALHRAFDWKLKRWTDDGQTPAALKDRRKENGAAFDLPEDDRDKLIHRAVFNYYGVVAAAWRDLLIDGFSELVRTRYAGKAFKKSHVPRSVMDDVSPEVEILTVMHQGPRAFDSIKGHVTRNYDGISSLQCMSADDFTLNSYFYVPDGKGWFTLTRGQTILFIDFRSLRILGYALEPRASYSSLTIRSLCTHVFSEFGLPEVLYFERGLWKRAILLKGKKDPFTFAQISSGLAEFGILFKHAIRPRTKAVERVGGLFQSMAEAEPGYCGRDERHDAPESLRKQMAEVETRKVHPSKYFYSFEQWNRRIGEIADQYNSTAQQGKILAGMSPDQAFKMFINADDPPKQFDAGLRYLLAHEKRVARVTLNGVTIEIGKQRFNYRGRELANSVGREVLAWFDPENPEALVVTDLERQNPVCLARSQEPNALECLIAPGAAVLGDELRRIEDQAQYMKTRFTVLKAKFQLPARAALASAQTVDLGRQIELGKGRLEGEQEAHRRNVQQARRFAADYGIVRPAHSIDGGDPEDGKYLRKFLNSDTPAKQPKQETPAAAKTYVLKPAGSPQRQHVDYLLKRLTEFRKAGQKSFGQSFAGEITFHSVARIARAQLKCDLYAPEHFEAVCAHLQEKIDATVLGKRNTAQGIPNYHSFQEATI